MTKRWRLALYTDSLGVGGTAHDFEVHTRHHDPEKFEIFIVARRNDVPPLKRLETQVRALLGKPRAKDQLAMWKGYNHHKATLQSLVGKDHVILVDNESDLRRTLLALKTDMLHVSYSGAPQPPISDHEIMTDIPIVVATHAFEIHDTSPSQKQVKAFFFSSNWLWKEKALWARDDPRAGVRYCPIEEPSSKENLRAEFSIPQDAIVVGRSGRPSPNIHDSISLKAYRMIQNERTWFLALSAPANMVREAQALGVTNFVAIPTGQNHVFLSKFYNTIDVLAHARKDGETFGRVLAEAMIHGKPVVSHYSHIANAQPETIGPGGWVVARGDHAAYAEKLALLRDDPELRVAIGAKGRAHAREHYEAKKLTRRLEALLLSLAEKNALEPRQAKT